MTLINDVGTLLSYARSGVWSLQQLVGFWQPIAPLPLLIAPLTAVAAALMAAVLAGIAISSLTMLIVALLALEYLLVEVLGFSIESITV